MTVLSRTRVAVLGAALVAGGLVAAPASAAGPTGDYIVVLKDSATAHPSLVAEEHRRTHGAQVRFTYSSALRGYAARLSGTGLAEVKRDRRVAYVEADGVATASATQPSATWGLDRIDQRSLPLTGTYTYGNAGTGVNAYVIDTGILAGHTEFTGRLASGHTSINDGRGTGDCNGHGTHVAGTVGGTTYGVAKGVTLVPVRVLDCGGSGTWSGVIAGIDWAASNHASGTPAVANLSLGGGASTAVDNAVKNLIADGVVTAVAAGNDGRDACRFSPARVPTAMTVGATDKADKRTSWSNLGACVDWFAPGASITSAWHTGVSATNTISGTSMASPHTAGVAALYLQGSPGASPQQVRDALYAATTKAVVASSRSTNNHLLYTSY